MMKKKLIFMFVLIVVSSCGKKGDPFYNDQNQNSEIIRAQESTPS